MVNLEGSSCLIYDIETCTTGARPNGARDKFRLFAAYSFQTNKTYMLTKPRLIKQLIKEHKFLVGFNNKEYDNNVLYRMQLIADSDAKTYDDRFVESIYKGMYRTDSGICGFSGKITVDLMEIFKKRASAMKIKRGMLADLLMRFTLDYISKTIEIVDDDDGKIGGFDYGLLQPEASAWTDENKKIILDYTRRDIDVTRKMYEWLEEYFDSFKDFVTQENIDNKSYLTCSTAVFGYKAICKALDIKEEYSDNVKNDKFKGGYVAYPAGEFFEGEMYCLDFNSLYPSVMHQCNIYSHVDKGWTGNGKFKVNGTYNNEVQGKMEQLLKKWYEQRMEYKKKGDSREYSIKIILNSMYGASANATFKNLFDMTSAADITRLGRQWVQLSRKRFKEAGYEIAYTDTDSVYLVDPFKNKKKLLAVKDKMIKEIKDNIPFPYKYFDMGVDDEITHMWFFKSEKIKKDEDESEFDEDDFVNKPKGFMKKNYLYLTTDGKLKFKNLGVKKKSCSTITRKLFNEILVPKIKEEKRVKFEKEFLNKQIKYMLDEDINLTAKRYNSKAVEEYKSQSCIHAQIAKRYGPGIHMLVKNNRYGVGKGSKYCTMEEFNEKGFGLDDLDLKGIWKELKYFTLIDESDLVPKKKSRKRKVDYSVSKLEEFF